MNFAPPYARRFAWSRLACFAPVLCLALSLHSQVRFISGMVQTESGRPLGGISVRVTLVGDCPTRDSGEFRIMLPQQLQPGSQIELHVKGWRIKSPFGGLEFVPRDEMAVIHIVVADTADYQSDLPPEKAAAAHRPNRTLRRK